MKDTYNEALREVIDAKIEGKEIVTIEEEEPVVIDIMTALKASIDKAKTDKKPMKKAGESPESESKSTKKMRKSA